MPQFCSKYSVIETSQAFSNTEVAFVGVFPLSMSAILPAFGVCFRCLLFPHSGRDQSSMHADKEYERYARRYMMISEKPNSEAVLRVGVEGAQGQRSWRCWSDFISNQLVDINPMLATQKSIY